MSKESPESGHQFWDTQPVPQTDESIVLLAGPLDAPKTVADVPDEPYTIASTFEWWTPDLQKHEDLMAIYELLRDNYVEDGDSMFRFNYSEEFLRWALTPPDYIPEWHVAVRRRKDQKLLAFISGIPLVMKMGTPRSVRAQAEKAAADAGEPIPEFFDEPRRICEINFLCIHKMLREKRLAPILIKEVTRRVNKLDMWQAVYTAGVLLPTPFTSGQYFHRNLNPEKLVAIRFSAVPPMYKKFQNPMVMLKRTLQLPAQTSTAGLRAMAPADVPQVGKLLAKFLARYDVAPIFSEAEVRHYLLPRGEVVYTYVVEHNGALTDFFSFYSLPSTVIGNSQYSQLNAAYVHYYAALETPVDKLMLDMLILAQQKQFDVCNIVGILDNPKFIEKLKFSPGDGNLHYYFYNWAYPKVDPIQVGLVML